MTAALLPGNQLYRIGGDEFIIVLQAPDVNGIYAQNNALLGELHSGIDVEGVTLDITYSAGAVCVYNSSNKMSLSC